MEGLFISYPKGNEGSNKNGRCSDPQTKTLFVKFSQGLPQCIVEQRVWAFQFLQRR